MNLSHYPVLAPRHATPQCKSHLASERAQRIVPSAPLPAGSGRPSLCPIPATGPSSSSNAITQRLRPPPNATAWTPIPTSWK